MNSMNFNIKFPWSANWKPSLGPRVLHLHSVSLVLLHILARERELLDREAGIVLVRTGPCVQILEQCPVQRKSCEELICFALYHPPVEVAATLSEGNITCIMES